VNTIDEEISVRDFHAIVLELLTRFNQVFSPSQCNNIGGQGNTIYNIFSMEEANIENPKGISWKHSDGGIKMRAYADLEAKARVENCCLENTMNSWVAE
jgi:hypothetical protein